MLDGNVPILSANIQILQKLQKLQLPIVVWVADLREGTPKIRKFLQIHSEVLPLKGLLRLSQMSSQSSFTGWLKGKWFCGGNGSGIDTAMTMLMPLIHKMHRAIH